MFNLDLQIVACYGKLKLLNFASTERKKLDLNGGFANMISTFVILGLFEYSLYKLWVLQVLGQFLRIIDTLSYRFMSVKLLVNTEKGNCLRKLGPSKGKFEPDKLS